jgi:hypothetical protein
MILTIAHGRRDGTAMALLYLAPGRRAAMQLTFSVPTNGRRVSSSGESSGLDVRSLEQSYQEQRSPKDNYASCEHDQYLCPNRIFGGSYR